MAACHVFRRTASLSAALATMLMLSTLGFAIVAAGGGDRPSWRVGDYWQYDGWQRSGPFPGGPYAHRIEVAAVEPVNASGIQYEAYRLDDTWTFPSGGIVPIRMWHTTNDLSSLKIENSLPVMFMGFCTNGACSSTYSPPIPVYQFPLFTGKQWSATSTRTVLTGYGTTMDTLTVTMRVSSEQDLSVSLNESGQNATRTFHTFAIGVMSIQIGSDVFTFSPFALLLYYADVVGLWVKFVQYYEDGTTAGEYNLTSFQYTPPPATPPWFLVGVGAVFGAGLMAAAIWSRRRRNRRKPTLSPPEL